MQPYSRPNNHNVHVLDAVETYRAMASLESTLTLLLAWMLGSPAVPATVASLVDTGIDLFLGRGHQKAKNPQIMARLYLNAAFCSPDLSPKIVEKLQEIIRTMQAHDTRRTRAYFAAFCACCDGERWKEDAAELYRDTYNELTFGSAFDPKED